MRLGVLQQMDGSSPLYGDIGMDDYTLYPSIRPGAFVRIDPRQKKIPAVHWHSNHDRPIFFVELREHYVCSCEMHGWPADSDCFARVQTPARSTSAIPLRPRLSVA